MQKQVQTPVGDITVTKDLRDRSLSYRKYTDINGVERSVTEIVADKIDLCGNRTETTTPAACEPQPSMPHDDIGDLPPSDGMPF